MFKPFVVLFSLAWLGIATAQDGRLSLPPVHQRSGSSAPATAPKEASVDPCSLYRNCDEAAAAAFQAAFRAATVERSLARGMRLFLVSLRRDSQNPMALFDIAVLCEQGGRWSDALSFLGEARRLAAPGSATALAVAAEIPRAQVIERLERNSEGKLRLQYNLALLAANGRSKDPFAGLKAVAELAQIDKTRWETAALTGMLHAQSGQFAECVRDLGEAARLAVPAKAENLKRAIAVASREAGYREQLNTADPLWEARQWEQAAKAYEQAWEKGPRHTDAAMLAVTGYLMIDQVDPAVALLARLRNYPTPAGTKAAAMLKELAAVSPAAAKAAAAAAAPVEPEPDPVTGIADLVGPLTTPEMVLEAMPGPALLADRTPVVPIPDKELDSGDASWSPLSTESLFQSYQAGIPPPSVQAKEPETQATSAPAKALETQPTAAPAAQLADVPPPVDSTGGRGGAATIESNPSGAQMLVDDTVRCTTPCLIALPPGRHTLRAELAGYRLAQRVIETPKNAPPPTITVVLDQKRGSLEVDSTPPGALVILDGRPTGKPTPAMFQLSEGKHKVGIEVDGKVRDGEVTITDNGLTRLQL